MPLILTVLHGQANGERFAVTAARSPTLIGRSRACEVVVDDGYVSETHAAVYFDASGARLRDLGSQSGTWINGGAVPGESALSTGDRVQIGQTMFGVEVLAEEAPAPEEGDALGALVATFQTTPRDCARFALRAEESALYALVDLAADPELLELLNESGEEFCALDEAVEPDALGETAPCLIAFSRGSVLLGDLLEVVWGRGTAVFFTSDAEFKDVYAHWVGWVEYDDEGEVTSPHVWEPEVLSEALAGFEGAELREFFGPARAFLAETEEGRELVRWTERNGALHAERVELSVGAARAQAAG